MKKPEILSPAGDWECLRSALSFGADAVFLAGKSFGMRSAPKNFDDSELKAACELAHSMDKKIHLTCNILPRNGELAALPDFLMMAQDCGVDALIIADMGVFEMAKRYAPKVARHVSTQAGVTNYAAAKALYDLGASRVVMAREMPLDARIEAVHVERPVVASILDAYDIDHCCSFRMANMLACALISWARACSAVVFPVWRGAWMTK